MLLASLAMSVGICDGELSTEHSSFLFFLFLRRILGEYSLESLGNKLHSILYIHVLCYLL